jgi:hypothetical protein
MNRTIQLVSGICVFLLALLNAIALLKMVPYYRAMEHPPAAGIMSACLTGVVIVFAFIGTYILVIGAKNSK